MADVKEINRKLEGYGKHIDGRPIFRLIWSTPIVEVRHGEFEEVARVPVDGRPGEFTDIHMGYVTRTSKDQKYAATADRWIIEKLVFLHYNPELPETPGYFYEPLHVFQDAQGNYLPPEWFAIEYLMFSQLQPRGGLKVWAERYSELERGKRLAQLAKALGIDQNPSRVEGSFAFKEATALRSTAFNPTKDFQ